ncbi:hypothetical protein [Haloarcula argentinensis]|uniref:Uncharacterized protein n=1 Tax=Haloarcula argentinensis TaxID=43776 RepID=A0A830FX86_HALAR|nr:hypothetical protein [Haloarcula argentinensis]GGM52428.1 hypothetical protein GCM10009006_36970 [Haloarcula argentinensis]
MVQIQGIKIAATMIALVLAMTTVNTLAASAGVVVEVDSGGVNTQDIKSINGNITNPEPSGVGSQDPGFFGIATGMTQTFQQLFALTTSLHAILKGWGVPPIIANSAQIMVDFVIGLALYQILRGTVF